MHLRNFTTTFTDAEKDSRARLWYSVVSLERVMAIMTGRPSMVRDGDCSVPLPSVDPQEEILYRQQPQATNTIDFAYHPSRPDSSGSVFSGLYIKRPTLSNLPSATAYFRHYVELNSFAVSVASRLYAADTRHVKWSEIQMRIFELDEKLVQWASMLLPQGFDVLNPYHQKWQPTKDPFQIAMGMLFNTIRSIVHRPCLCRIERSVPNQSHAFQEASYNSAKKCVQSARAILAFLPDKPDLQLFYLSPLWWILHHLIKRAGTVLLLELAVCARHMPSACEQVSLDAKKAVNWLRAAATTSATAEQSWITLSRLLQLTERKIGGLDSAHFGTSYNLPPQQPQPRPQRQQQQHQNPGSDHYQPSHPTIGSFPDMHDAAVRAGEGEWQQPMGERVGEYTGGDFQGEAIPFDDLEISRLDQLGFFQPNSASESFFYFPTPGEMEGIVEVDFSFASDDCSEENTHSNNCRSEGWQGSYGLWDG